ncbi:MAG: hypothetical protein HFH82_13540 [Lachnospiraceae bacterium]|nr:hypothetical protein [Lachnospiraceae bacterium]
MYWITMAVAGGYVVLFVFARREDTPPDFSIILVPFYKMSLFLLKRIWPKFPGFFASSQVEKDLFQLHPSEAKECLKTEYYGRKMSLCLAVILFGVFLCCAVKFSAQSEGVLGQDGIVKRGDFRDDIKDIRIVADCGKQKMEFRLQVEPVQLTESEAKALFDEFLEVLPNYIKGENESLQAISKDLKLENEYDSYPIWVEWDSGEKGLLSDSGHVFSIAAPKQVWLKAHLTYGKYNQDAEFLITLLPPVVSEEERLYQELEQILLNAHDNSLDEKDWKLPAEWKGERIYWQQVIEDNSLLFWVMTLGTVVLIYFFFDKDLHDQIERRKKSLHRDYPEIVHKLVLFVGAGMTIRGAFQKIASDFDTKQKGTGKQSPACAEMLYTCGELCAGVSEGAAYEHFGKRTGLQEYIRLSTLLAQNLKRGNSTLLERLREEADKAAEEQLQQSRKLGEEAETKLLAPMVLMLAIVMALIMIPAFSNL